MNHLFLSVCILIAIPAGMYVSLSAAEHTTVTILSPHDGETVTDTFILTYEILNRPKEDHPRVFLDGLYLKEFNGTFSRLPYGEHTITVRVDGQRPPRRGASVRHHQDQGGKIARSLRRRGSRGR